MLQVAVRKYMNHVEAVCLNSSFQAKLTTVSKDEVPGIYNLCQQPHSYAKEKRMTTKISLQITYPKSTSFWLSICMGIWALKMKNMNSYSEILEI